MEPQVSSTGRSSRQVQIVQVSFPDKVESLICGSLSSGGRSDEGATDSRWCSTDFEGSPGGLPPFGVFSVLYHQTYIESVYCNYHVCFVCYYYRLTTLLTKQSVSPTHHIYSVGVVDTFLKCFEGSLSDNIAGETES